MLKLTAEKYLPLNRPGTTLYTMFCRVVSGLEIQYIYIHVIIKMRRCII
jgi:hypothetical protein